MSKELTEQWWNGTLKEGWYYIHLMSDWGTLNCITINYCDEEGIFEEYPDEDIKEVLAPVPSYYEYNELVQKMHKLEKQLSSISEQLKEAEDVIRFYANTDGLTEEEKQMTAEKYHLVYGLKAIDYLEKWSVK